MELRGVKFGIYHTAKDWKLILNAKDIPTPEPKTTYTSIEGRNDDLDQSESIKGEIAYNNRTLSFTFLLTEGTYLERNDLIETILSKVHGKRLDIVLDDNTSVFFNGRCKVFDVVNNNAYGSLKIEAYCGAYAHKIVDTTVSTSLTSEAKDIIINNPGAESAIPTFVVENEATIVYGTSSITLNEGSHRVPDYLLKHGLTTLSVKGSGSLTIIFREGYLYV